MALMAGLVALDGVLPGRAGPVAARAIGSSGLFQKHYKHAAGKLGLLWPRVPARPPWRTVAMHVAMNVVGACVDQPEVTQRFSTMREPTPTTLTGSTTTCSEGRIPHTPCVWGSKGGTLG